MSDWPEEGTNAPLFTLDTNLGNKASLKEERGNWVVLYFYPKDNTPGCTKEACAFRDRMGAFEELGAKVYGVSPDDVDSHKSFYSKYLLNFPLLADKGHKVAEKYGAWREKNMYGKVSMGIKRSTFIIDPAGKIAKIWKAVRVDGHELKVLEALQKLAK
ncbi:MAG: thioredoxin-dependent thiol peroxidase [Pirellulaceae bacterium]|nr:thioredoxin-dependent thiol peroxidase [Pirellulaceae bacterium]